MMHGIYFFINRSTAKHLFRLIYHPFFLVSPMILFYTVANLSTAKQFASRESVRWNTTRLLVYQTCETLNGQPVIENRILISSNILYNVIMLLLHTTCYIKKRTSKRFERAFLFSSETSGPSPPFGLGLYCSDSFATISLMCGSLIEAIISPSCIPSIGLTLVFSLVPVEPWIPLQTYHKNFHH